MVLLVLVVPCVSSVQGATETESSLRLTFSVEAGSWCLSGAHRLPEPCRPNWTERGSSYYAAVLDAEGNVQAATPLGRPELRFHDYKDETQKLSGGVEARESFIVSFRIPALETDYQVVIRDKEQQEVLRLAAVEIESALAAKRDTWPIYALDTLVYNGDPAEKIDIIFLGDGYLEADTTVYLNAVNMHVNYIFGIEPFTQYSERFNIYAVTTISAERGADHPEWGVYRDTYYHAEYWGRLLTVSNTVAYGVANEHVPQWDEICAIVQDPEYGGSGGPQVAVSYSASTQVLTHEFGHSFGLLWDEYSYGGDGSVGTAPNCDDNVVNPKWQYWIDSLYPGVGTYMGCSYDNTYRPTWNSCMMLELKDYFCIVCIEQIINRIYDYAPNPLQTTSPEQVVFIPAGESMLFEFSYANQSDYPLEAVWLLDGFEQIDSTGNTFYFTPPVFGNYELTASLYDTTSLVLNLDDSVLTTNYTWNILSEELICGDCDSDGVVNVTDVVYLVQYVFAGGPPPVPLEAGDADCSGTANISDAVYLVAYIFAGGPVPCADCQMLFSVKTTDENVRGSL
jgi:hypothetical protein